MPKKLAPAKKAKKTLENRLVKEGRSVIGKKAAKKKRDRERAKKAAKKRAENKLKAK
jgi:predicted kinase